MILNEVHTISLSECSVELDTGAGCDDTLLVLFSLLAVGTLKHGEAAATGLRGHTHTHTNKQGCIAATAKCEDQLCYCSSCDLWNIFYVSVIRCFAEVMKYM